MEIFFIIILNLFYKVTYTVMIYLDIYMVPQVLMNQN